MEIAAVMALLHTGRSPDVIVQETGVSRRSVFRLLAKSKLTENKVSDKKLGRPQKTTDVMDDFIIATVEANRKTSPKELQKFLKEKFNVSLCLSKFKLLLVAPQHLHPLLFRPTKMLESPEKSLRFVNWF